MESVTKELTAPESHQHPEPLTDLSGSQSYCELPVKEPLLTPTQVRAITMHYACTHIMLIPGH